MMNMDSGILVVDNSNTRTKFLLKTPAGVSELRLLPTAGLTIESVRELVSDWNFAQVCVCSVVPSAAQVIKAALGEDVVRFVRVSDDLPVDFSSYAGVGTLGADRVANVLSAVRYAELPLVAVDAGTATTLDVVLAEGEKPRFAGGMIAPGMMGVASCLNQCTALLPVCDYQMTCPVIGGNTSEAMASAVRIGYPGMIDALLDAIEEEVGQPVHVVLTGGDAEFLAPKLRHAPVVVPSLTLEGVLIAAEIDQKIIF